MSYIQYGRVSLEKIVEKGKLDLQCMKMLESKYPILRANLAGDIDSSIIEHCKDRVDVTLFVDGQRNEINPNSLGFDIIKNTRLVIFDDEPLEIDGRRIIVRVYTSSKFMISNYSSGTTITLCGGFGTTYADSAWEFIVNKKLDSQLIRNIIAEYNGYVRAKYYKKIEFEEKSFPPAIYKRIIKMIMFS